jgi:uncharacterized protein YciI
MHFAVYALDKPDAGLLRAELGDAHRARLRGHDHPVEVVIAGPLLDEAGNPIGSLIVIEAASIGDVRAFMDADPYILNGVYESADIKPVKWTIGTPPGS